MQLSLVSICMLVVAAHCHNHECIHSKLNFPPSAGVPQPSSSAQKFMPLASTTNTNMRFKYFVNVDGLGSCNSVGQTVTAYFSKTAVCTANDLLTSNKLAYISKLMDGAVSRLSLLLNFTNDGTPLMPGATCGDIAHSNAGITDADFVIYVSAVPTASPSSTLAWAYACVHDSVTRRSIVGHVNFVPAVLGNADSLNPVQLEYDIGVATHEITHALGFSAPFFGAGVLPLSGSKNTSDSGLATYFHAGLGKSVTRMVSPRVQAKARQYFNCPTLDGVEIEDGGGDGTKGSHWEKRILSNELMVGVISTKRLYVSEMLLAFFEDTGYYAPNYDQASKWMNYGKNTKCDIVDNTCNATINADKKSLYCFTPTPSDTYQCTQDRLGLGFCGIRNYTTDVPYNMQYFSDPKQGGEAASDYCPYVVGFSNTVCIDGTKILDTTFGNNYTMQSRCFTSDLTATQFQKDAWSARCLGYDCRNGAIVIYLSDAVAFCPLDGSEGNATFTSTAWKGAISCPPAWEICPPPMPTTIGSQTSIPSAPTVTTGTETTGQPSSPPSTIVETTGQPLSSSSTIAETTGQPLSPLPTIAETTGQPSSPPPTIVETTGQPSSAPPPIAETTGQPSYVPPVATLSSDHPAVLRFLSQLFVDTQGKDWKLNTVWMHPNISACQWYGISCDLSGNIVTILLSGNNLNGDISRLNFDVVPLVTKVDLSNNRLAGRIPPSLFFCPVGTNISLRKNYFTKLAFSDDQQLQSIYSGLSVQLGLNPFFCPLQPFVVVRLLPFVTDSSDVRCVRTMTISKHVSPTLLIEPPVLAESQANPSQVILSSNAANVSSSKYIQMVANVLYSILDRQVLNVVYAASVNVSLNNIYFNLTKCATVTPCLVLRFMSGVEVSRRRSIIDRLRTNHVSVAMLEVDQMIILAEGETLTAAPTSAPKIALADSVSTSPAITYAVIASASVVAVIVLVACIRWKAGHPFSELLRPKYGQQRQPPPNNLE